MKSKLIITILLLTVISGLVSPVRAAPASPSAVSIDINRVITSGPFGVTQISDAFTVVNNGAPTSYLDVGFLAIYRIGCYYVRATDNLGRALKIDADVNPNSDVYWMRVNYAQELNTGLTYKFTVISVFYGLMLPVGSGFEFNFTAAPILTQDARVANVTLLASQDSSFITIPGATYNTTRLGAFPALIAKYQPWKAYSKDSLYVPIRSVTQQFLFVLDAKRDIIIGEGGSLSVKDSYAFYNPSVIISSMIFPLPDGAYNIMAYDTVGPLWASPQNPNAPYQASITPRYQTFRGREYFNFSLTYDLPASKYLKQLNWWGNYNLTIPLLNDDMDLLIRNATVRIIVPAGVSVVNLKIPTQSPVTPPFNVSANYQTIKLRGVTKLNNLTAGIDLSYLPFWSSFQILPWIFMFEMVVFAAIMLNRYKRTPTIGVPIPVERLREFVSLYDERLALSRELIAMEEDVNRGSMVKHEFRRRSKVMELRLNEINKSLMEVKSELRLISPRYDDLIKRIDRAEAEAEASRASINQVRNQYRSGRITREAYNTVSNDIAKRINRAEETVETILITLREEAR